MPDVPIGERTIFLSEVPAGPGERRLAGAVVFVSAAAFLALVPFARTQLPAFPAFIAIYQAALFINDLITVVFLLGLSQLSRRGALSWLAGGYLFTALISAVHALTFPGLFSTSGLLHAGPQTTAWLYVFWHAGFPLFVIAYASATTERQAPGRVAAIILNRIATVFAAVCTSVLIATIGRNILPALVYGNRFAPAETVIVAGVWLLNLAALIMVTRRRPYSVLDLWLVVVACAWLFDIALSAMLNASRFDLGFYAGRIYGLVAASLVLIVLLYQNGKLYLQLVGLHQSERDKSAVLRELSTIDPLTGIANRRAFDEALDVEWRRTMRHGHALSLLLLDIDFFKRFNDTYGHVAGDRCLRAVAQAVAGRARRAGELAARYGGEEFAVLLPSVGLADAAKLAELICQSVRELNIARANSDAATHITISIGAACLAQVQQHAPALSREDNAAPLTPATTLLIEAADHALYRAKAAGRNRVAVAAAESSSAAAA